MAEPGVTQRLAAAGAAFTDPPAEGTVSTEPGALDAAGTRSPLSGLLGPAGGPVTFEERPFVGKLTLRGDPSNADFMAAAGKVLGTDIPTDPCRFVEHDGFRVHWIGFDNWLIHVPEGAEGPLKTKLEAALEGIHSAIVDVSDYYTVIRVQGAKARRLLQKGCPIDLHPRTFGPGQCAGTVFHHAAIFLAQTDADTDGGASYDIQIRWSFARYLWDYFVDGAREWGG
ncbi:hypothetical protein KAJ83_12305 [Marivibrio halodurans]|uniref:Sarcosine oxidase subunit gamma n=1 Tax=Marivibrio halodurans TaxID=2039722 RepID=A0A8J7V4K8_9PROT|nr:sarcosine oxidase subunit gamma family protein [Marivibrio halodurans]MBP5857794.1 hypothetical protein [Marivibrio halodurans]